MIALLNLRSCTLTKIRGLWSTPIATLMDKTRWYCLVFIQARAAERGGFRYQKLYQRYLLITLLIGWGSGVMEFDPNLIDDSLLWGTNVQGRFNEERVHRPSSLPDF